MKLREFEPVLTVPFKFENETKKYKIKRLSNKTIKKIQKDLSKNATKEQKSLEKLKKEIEDFEIKAEFLKKKLDSATDLKQVEKLESEFFTLKNDAELKNKKIEEIEEKTGEYEDEALCLATAGDEETKEFFEKVAEKYGWEHLSKIIADVFKEYDEDFLSA